MKKIFTLVLVLAAFVISAASVFAQDSTAPSGAKSEKCENSFTVETGVLTQYLEIETAEVYYRKPVVQTELTYERCGNKRTSYGFTAWTSASITERNPSGATELDVLGFVNTKLTDKVNLYVDAGVFFYPENFKIYKANVTLSRSFELSETVEATLSNSFSVYKTNDSTSTSGVINRVSMDFEKSLSKGTLTISPSFSLDNNPFSLGSGKVVGMARLYGRYDIPISKKVDFFVMGGISSPVFGDTDRKFRKVGGVGLVIRF